MYLKEVVRKILEYKNTAQVDSEVVTRTKGFVVYVDA